MLNLPLALIGGVVGVFVSGGVLSVASLIGFITVFGIATRNGIMLVSHIRHLQEHEGVTDFREAVVRGAIGTAGADLMTALAAGLALIPLALGGGKPGSEIETPMAIVILFGLSSSMVLNMVVVPTLYLRYGRPVGIGSEVMHETLRRFSRGAVAVCDSPAPQFRHDEPTTFPSDSRCATALAALSARTPAAATESVDRPRPAQPEPFCLRQVDGDRLLIETHTLSAEMTKGC
jgi:hypothetical protein